MKNATDKQLQLLDDLKKIDKDVIIRWSEERGVASLLQGRLLNWDPEEKPQELLRKWLHTYGQLVGSNDAFDNIEYVETTKIPPQSVQIRAMQKAEGLPIYGATLLLFANKERVLYRVQSGLYRDPKVPSFQIDFEVREKELVKRLRKRLETDPKGLEFSKAFKKMDNQKVDSWAVANFPILEPPKLLLYPTKQGLKQIFTVYAYQPIKWLGISGEKTKTIETVTLFIDAKTGRIIVEQGPLGMSYVDTNGDGSSTLVDSANNYITRPLLVVQNTSNDFLLINRSHTPNIITHNCRGTQTGMENAFQNDTNISLDVDSHWNSTTTSCSSSNRANSQQPETDGHFFAEEAFNFYTNLGWQGFDNGRWGTHCPIRVATHIGLGANASFWRYITNGKHYGYVKFYDGTCSGNNIEYDFMAGDPAVFAHEYQHGITYFGARDSLGNPGYLEVTGWHRAIHEGLSDSMAGFRTESWVTPGFWSNGVTRGAKPFRRIEFPRSTDTKDNIAYLDHFDDRSATSDPYVWSTILSHAAFLAGQGGVHQRIINRDAELIPVAGIGVGDAIKIFHYAVINYFDNIPANSTGGNTMIEAARLILDAAETVTGTRRSGAYVMLRRAFYAVGLYPYDESYNKITYGGEACMLPWTVDWWRSSGYLGFPPLWWQSPDLFINNGNGPEYDAKVGQENKLFARVRNIGDQDINNVSVKFYFIAYGTNLPPSSTQWKECKDINGNVCVLNIPNLAAGSMNFTDENNPPANQAVNWYLSPAEVVQGLDHFCIRAEILSNAPNNDNDYLNIVQSNISYTPLTFGGSVRLCFMVANWEKEPIPIEVEIKHTLPKSFKVKYAGKEPLKDAQLKPKEQKLLCWQAMVPKNAAKWLDPPYNGRVIAEVEGDHLNGLTIGELSDVHVLKGTILQQSQVKSTPISIQGKFVGTIKKRTNINGTFKGKLNLSNHEIKGKLNVTAYTGKRIQRKVSLNLKGTLEPLRSINFIQKVRNKQVGGVSIKLKMP